MNHDLAAVLDYLDQRFGATDQQAFEQRLDQEPHLRELLEKTKTMQRNLRSIFGQSENLVAPTYSPQRLGKFAKFKYTLNALLLVVLLLGGVYLKQYLDLAPQLTDESNNLARIIADPSTPKHQTLLMKGLDNEQNYFIQALQAAQVMWRANNVEALIIADNGDRFELSKSSEQYLLTRRSSNTGSIWQQTLPYDPDSIGTISLYSNDDQSELYITAQQRKQLGQTANVNRSINIIPKNQITIDINSVEDHSSTLGQVYPDNPNAGGSIQGGQSPITSTTAIEDKQKSQIHSGYSHSVSISETYITIDSKTGKIKYQAQQCDCNYLASNQKLYLYNQSFPFKNYFDYEITPTNSNILTIFTYDQNVITYDLTQQKTLNSTKLQSNQQLNDRLRLLPNKFGLFELGSTVVQQFDIASNIRFSGNQKVMIIRDSDDTSTTFYAFDLLSGNQLWKKTLLRSFTSFTTNWDGSEVYAIRTSTSNELKPYSTLYTISANDLLVEQYLDQRIEELTMVYDF